MTSTRVYQGIAHAGTHMKRLLYLQSCMFVFATEFGFGPVTQSIYPHQFAQFWPSNSAPCRYHHSWQSRPRKLRSASIRRIHHAVIVVMHTRIRRTSPVGEVDCFSTPTKDGEREDEDQDLRSSVHGGRHQVVPLDEELWVILAQVELADECDDEEHGQRAVDADEQIAHCIQSAK